MPHGFAVFDAASKLVTCNSAYASLYDVPPGELVGATITDLIPRFLGSLRSIEGRPPYEAELPPEQMFPELWKARAEEPLEVELKDGRHMMISRHPTAEGGYATLRTDISEIKSMETALRDSELLVRTILDACPMPISMTRPKDGKLVYLNPAGHALFGSSRPDGKRERVQDLYVDPVQRAGYLAALREGSAVDAYELEFHKADGATFWAAVSAREIDYKGEKVIVATSVDLTQQHALEEEKTRQRDALYQSEKINALGGLLAGVAHELNNPLSVVVGQALLLSETVSDPKIQRRAERIGTAAQRCSRIVKTFLAMARQSAPVRAEVDLNEVIQAALDITTYSLRSANVEVTCELDEDLPAVWGDADQLTQVLMNLVVNAEQAMTDQVGPRKLKIVSRRQKARKRVQVIIEDNGAGIPPDVRSRIFEPYFTTKEFGVGTGIGLAMSHGIIQAHNGTVEVESAPGSGASFTISLPVSAGRGGGADATAVEAAGGTRCRILVVDDEPEGTETLAEVLAAQGHEVVTAASGNAAMRVLGDRTFDVILSDMRMPDVDGPGLFIRIKNAFPDLVDRIVFVTGDTLGPSNRSFLDQTGLPHLEKPIAPDELRQVIQDILKEQGAAEA
jgi:PAS domain S-box-containing protein